MSIIDSIKSSILVPIHPSGRPFIIIFAIIAVVLGIISDGLFVVGLVLLIWCAAFFRNPVRTTPKLQGAVIAPADGRILSVEDLPPPPELKLPEGSYTRIAIFMNVFNVHVNRAPMSGKIIDKFYFPGRYFNVSLDKASEQNERLGLVMESDDGRVIGFIQIAGLVARRILCDVGEGAQLEVGAQYGIIRFGSRVDVWLPKPVKTLVARDQTTIAGETVIASFGRGVKPVDDVVRR